MDWKFEPDDFKGKGFVVPTESNIFRILSEIANAKIAQWKKNAEYGHFIGDTFMECAGCSKWSCHAWIIPDGE